MPSPVPSLRRVGPLVLALATAFVLALPLTGCSERKQDTSSAPATATATTPAAREFAIPTCPCTYDRAAGDPSVPAELGGPGFTGEGWETVTEIPVMGRLDAPKGGTVTMHLGDWPSTLRQAGLGWHEGLGITVTELCFESLLNIHPVTLEFMPALATHWQISDDKLTYRFRLNPKARWSDGHEVTAEDVVATIRLRTDPEAGDASAFTFSKMDLPRAISKYIVEVRAKQPNWRNFLYMSGTAILPAHEIGIIDAKTYLDEYQFKSTAVTGPYDIRPENIEKGVALTFTRRPDYWGRDECFARGLWNFDRIKFVVVKDANLAFEKVKKGEIDVFGIGRAQWWAEEVDKIDGVRRGLIQKRKILTEAPLGWRGFAINTRRPPLDDRRIRLALSHLLNCELIIEKLYFNEYAPLCSYFPGGIYQNPGNRPTPYDPDQAAALLAEAGWSERGSDGILVNDGRRLELAVQYDSKNSERFLTLFQEDCQRAGIDIRLDLVSGPTRWKNLMDRTFELSLTGWGRPLFPNPEMEFRSDLADEKNNNNVTGFKSPRADSLFSAYDLAFEVKDRIRIIRELDAILFNEHHYILTWYGSGDRLIYWNRFGHPDWYLPRTGGSVLASWWIDPEKEKQVEAGKANREITMPQGETEVRYWEGYRGVEGVSASL